MQQQDLQNLIQDQRFINYCLNTNLADTEYWEKWVSDHPNDKNEIVELKKTVLLLRDHIGNIEAEAQFEKLNNQLSQQNANEPKRRKLLSVWLKVGTAAILAVAMGIGFYWIKQSNTQVKSTYTKDIGPGRNQATLTLANGKKISLTKANNGLVAAEGGIKITKTADGQLVYDFSKTTSNGSPSSFNTLSVPIGGQWQVILPDQTKVWLNAQSSITYPTKFNGNQRKVKISGEAYFEVAHNKKMPFKVESRGQVVEVLGTHFNIMAYADEEIIKTTLLEGSVKIFNNRQSQLLKPGQQAVASSNGISLSDYVDVEEAIAWKNGDFQFNENLETIMSKIARWYNVEVVYQVKPSSDLTFSGRISRSRNISAILKMLEYNGDVHFKIEGRRVIVTN
ncbi:hypothetical protein CA265_12200 [Sphingobacteriaceae bacterium GW460-11-11-14-LB5]|nr:hypothetical protein CA265_12200 [Sphingobacteriaceae bacterium GW460-11-11-14-LB5]